MEIIISHVVPVILYSALLIFVYAKRLKIELLLTLVIVINIFLLLQTAINSLNSGGYYLNHYTIVFSLFGWLIFLQQTYLKIPNIRSVGLFAVYGIDALLIILFSFQFAIDDISRTLLFDTSSLFLAGFIMALTGLYYLENIVRCLKPEFRYHHKHLIFALTVMAIINLLNFYQLLAYDESQTKFLYLSLLVHTLIPVFLFVSLLRSVRIDAAQLEPSETGHAQYFMILVGFAMLVAGLMQLFDLYFSEVRSDFYQAIFLALIIFFVGMLVLSNSLRTGFALYLKSYFYGDRNDYEKEWKKVSEIIRNENDINLNVLKYYSTRLKADNAALYLKKGKTFDLSEALDDTFSESILDGNNFFNNAHAISDNVYEAKKEERSNYYELYIKLSIGENIIGLCWLKFRRTPSSRLDTASLQLCQTVSTEFAIRLRELEQKAVIIRQQKLNGFNKIVTFLAHDLKNIAAQQQLAVENFSKYREDPEFLDDFNDTIQHSTYKLKEIISQFRYKTLNSEKKSVTFSQFIAGIKQKIRISDGVVKFSYRNVNNLETEFSEGVFVVVDNLLKNSHEATTNNEPVYLQIDLDSSLRIVVEDSGHGMTKEFIDQKLFEPFSSTKEDYGLGVGMYHVKTMLESMKADISVESTIGKGTIIIVDIPF